MATSTEIKQRANALADKTDVNSITPKEVGGIMYDLASHSENVLRNGGTLGIRKVYESVSAMEADGINPVDLWGNPIKKGNLVVIYDGTTTGVDNNKVYTFMNPGWELSTELDAGYATRREITDLKDETDTKLSELGSEVDELGGKQLADNVLTITDNKSEYLAQYLNGETEFTILLSDTSSEYRLIYKIDGSFKGLTGIKPNIPFDVILPEGYSYAQLQAETSGQTSVRFKAYTNGIVKKLEESISNVNAEVKAVKETVTGIDNFVVGGYIDKDGASIIQDKDYSYTEFIDVLPEVGNTIYCWHGGAEKAYIIAYDSNKDYITYYGNTSSSQRGITVPENCAYIRFSFLKDYSAYVSKSGSIIWQMASIGGLSQDIQRISDEMSWNGRDIINAPIKQHSDIQEIYTLRKAFGKSVGIRILYNDARLAEGTNIRANLYNLDGSAFSGLELSNEWAYYDSQTIVRSIYIQTTGEVISSGNITIEVIYDDYFRVSTILPFIDLGNITLSAKGDYTKLFEKSIKFNNVSNVKLEIVNFTSSAENTEIYLYGVYNGSGTDKRRLRDITENGKLIKIDSLGEERLYGLYIWNNNEDASVSLDLRVLIEDSTEGIHSIESYDELLSLPYYYREYVEEKQSLLRNLIQNSIIDGDVFYYISDTHWEYNAKNSPAVIKKLNSKLSIPRLFHGGDMYHLGLQRDKYNVDAINRFRSALGSDKVYTSDGNHEYIYGLATYGDVFAETRIFLDDVVFGGTNKNYYYVDNSQKKIRYINLYSYGTYIGDDITYGFEDDAQLVWLRDVALNVDEGWSIFIITHFIAAMSPLNNTIHELRGASNLYNIIDSYNGNGKILACIVGHTHYDSVVQNKCKCPIVATTSDHNYPFKESIGGGNYFINFSELIEPRNSGTVDEQAFDVVVFNKKEMKLDFVRIGSRAFNRSDSFIGDAQVDIRSVLINSINVGNQLTLSRSFIMTAWESSNENVASVNNGVVSANSVGTAVITGISSEGKKQSFFIKVE